MDDDGESVKLSFGTPACRTASPRGPPDETTVIITDDDKPTALTVQFGSGSYTVAEGSTVSVTVTLSDDPEHVACLSPSPPRALGGAGSGDYSGVPAAVTFSQW